MIPPKKPQRLFTGLVGLPPEPEDSKPETVPAPVVPSTPVYRTTAELVADLEKERKKKRAEDARARRKLKADQIKNIKEVLKVPIKQVKAEAEAKRKAEKLPRVDAGAYMSDAPRSKGKIVSGGYDPSKIDVMTGTTMTDSVWDGRRRARPEGNTPDQDFNRDEAEFNVRSHGGMHGWSGSGSRSFQVRLTADAEFDVQRALTHLVEDYFADSVCRLCHVSCQDTEDAKDHILTVHGGEQQPRHDARFGDVVSPLVKKLRREDKKRQAEAKKNGGKLTAGQVRENKKTESEREGWTQNGNWIQVAGKGWVQEWVRKKPVTG